MPFAPLSPVRLYASRKSRQSSNFRNIATTTSAGGIEAESPHETSSQANLASSTSHTAPLLATDHQHHMSPWNGDRGSEHRRSDVHLLNLNHRYTEPERPLSIHEALAIDTTGDEPTSQGQASPPTAQRASALFDNTSESEYSVEDDAGPVVGRASSVRVSKPQIVESKPIKLSKVHGQHAGHSRSSSRSSFKLGESSNHHPDALPTMLEESGQGFPGWTIRSVETGESEDSQALKHTGESNRRSYPLPAPTNLEIRNEGSEHKDTSYDMALRTGSTVHSVRPSITQLETPSVAAATESGITPVQRSDSTVSTPLMLPGKSFSRRVSIRPTDLITKDHHNHSSFRESVVTTPYPPRLSVEDNKLNAARQGGKGSAERESRMSKDKKRTSFPHSPGRTDRFPSPERPERLFLVLDFHKRPSARVTIEIEIVDKTTFDDEALFQQIKAIYHHQLLNRPRRAFSLIRKVSHITFTGTPRLTTRHHQNFDSANFLQHLQNPKIGQKRKSWVLWLRNHNSNTTLNRPASHVPQIHHIDNLTRLSTRSRSAPHSRESSAGTRNPDAEIDATDADTNVDKHLSTASDADSFYFAYSPAIPKLPFLTTRHNNNNLEPPSPASGEVNHTRQPHSQSPSRSFFWPSIPSNIANPPTRTSTTSLRKHRHRHARTNRSLTTETDTESQSASPSPSLPTITLQYSYRLTTITLLTLLNILFAIFCAVIWVIFGVPGTRPGSDHESQISVGGKEIEVGTDWRVNSQGRVLTGCVIALVVFVVGSVLEGLVLWMGKLVL